MKLKSYIKKYLTEERARLGSNPSFDYIDIPDDLKNAYGIVRTKNGIITSIFDDTNYYENNYSIKDLPEAMAEISDELNIPLDDLAIVQHYTAYKVKDKLTETTQQLALKYLDSEKNKNLPNKRIKS